MISYIKRLFSKETKVVTRFAPSPTGFMHIGGLRTALYSFMWARKNGGTFILRIEDTDTEREVPGSIEHIQEALRWLGLDWDYGPDKPGSWGSCIQSERLPVYIEYAKKLIDKGLAYPDPYSHEELEGFRKKAESERRPFLFREHRPATFGKWDGSTALRFKVPEIKRYKWTDAVRGELEAGEEALDDFILIKKDGYPTYNFAHIVDDHVMGVTHVMRADEFISSTPKFLSLYEGLAIDPPVFVTLPPILRSDKTKKLGKRDGAKDVLDYRKDGFLPEAMANFLALVGWNPGTEQEIFSFDELIQEFELSKIQRAGGVFNEEKLRWVNKEHLKRMPIEEFEKALKERIESSDRVKGLDWQISGDIIQKIAPVILERIETYGDIDVLIMERDLDYYFSEPVYDALSLKWKEEKDLTSAEKHLSAVRTTLKNLPDKDWDEEKIKAAIWPYAEREGRGQVLWPFRFALSGKEKSPNPFTLARILGKQPTVLRLEEAIKKCIEFNATPHKWDNTMESPTAEEE